jgi:hypothetical protein
MIPLLIKTRIYRQEKAPLTLYLPLFIGWLFLLLLFLILLPFLVIGALAAIGMGYGKIVLMSFPMLVQIFWNLRGLKVDVQSEDTKIYFSFI